MISAHQQQSQYESFLENEFTLIFCDSNDNSPTKPLYADLINRQQILFMQFQMQKKGKNFGITEWRHLKIENQILYQVGKNQQEKVLPYPISFDIVRKNGQNQEWINKYAQFQAKIIMKFSERNDITVYFRSIIECNEIAMFLLSKLRQSLNKGFLGLSRFFKSKLVANIVQKIKLSKQSNLSLKNIKNKLKLHDYFKNYLNDKNYITNFLQYWMSKSLFLNQKISFRIIIVQVNSKFDESLTEIKIWAKGIMCKHILVNKQNSTAQTQKNHKITKFTKIIQYQFIDFLSIQQIQLECLINGQVWKTERFLANDLKKHCTRFPKIQLNLSNKGQINFIRIVADFQKQQRIVENKAINPKYYRIIDQLYNKQQIPVSLPKIHQHFSSILRSQRQTNFYYTSFSKFKQLNELLKIQDLIIKFYSVPPFNQYQNTQNKGTFIFEYFSRNFNRDLYYQVQKLIWRFKQKQYKRVLVALKTFDQNPKFNFTDIFFYLVKRMYQIAQRETMSRSKQLLFSKNIKGIESICFFLCIGVIKAFPSIYIHQQFINKRALPYNSILFLYVLNKELPLINQKINNIELNIQALFGINFVNLFCKNLQGETFNRVLIMSLLQKKQDGQSIYIFTLIAVFITIVKMIDKYNCTYASAEHYIIVFQEYCKNIQDKFQFFQDIKKWKSLAKEYSLKAEFQELSKDMTQFYINNAYSGQLGEISKQIYQQFTCYHYKNESDLRKIMIFVDKIDIGPQEQSYNLTLSIFQSAIKLYQHDFKGIRLNQIGHFIEIKLIKLQQLTIICNTEKNSYTCRIDPKQVPSNLYFHFVKPLVFTHHLSPEQNRHIFFQAYIKDSCQIQTLQNPIPNKYRQIFLQKQLSKQSINFCKRFVKTFRMRENNFNLLYSKLGWFGNHYIIPDQRLIDINILGSRQGGKQELQKQIYKINKYTRFIYGKALAPFPSYEGRRLSLQLIKQNIHTHYEPTQLTSLKSSLTSEFNIYNSAGRLLSYSLDNFRLATSIQFLQFYYEINEKLPLIRYLSYNPKLFYLLPTFTIQVSSYSSVCTVIFSEKGLPLITKFSQAQIQQIEEKSIQYSRMPQEIQFGYTDEDMYFDYFLFLLRLNILKRVIAIKDKKSMKPKKWANSLVSTSVYIPNYKLHNFYEVMNETKQIIQLQFKQSKKPKKKLEYNDFGLIGNRWIKVYCIAQLNTSQLIYFYVLSELQQKKWILKQEDFIKVDEEEKKVVDLTDDIAHSMEIITYELNQIFQI